VKSSPVSRVYLPRGGVGESEGPTAAHLLSPQGASHPGTGAGGFRRASSERSRDGSTSGDRQAYGETLSGNGKATKAEAERQSSGRTIPSGEGLIVGYKGSSDQGHRVFTGA
jgi:hypothetical protein